ncbi:MAG TPA: 16S rRNA (adenine(1518)-N(6)/adenine(1519)-N(6))-dimethyltransferase RsmA [Thermodesulfobacteriota bacterium]|nr:ribosomal RNA small subunit methyltransferase A [Deltaproteobacteria bacterium]HNR14516.1 16S rRNA (adenine(1518)-N(6)/adenine(1519)-N(6))-dimethyltransferase RsmA [Thermodesulfobacteriota bacterium]HOC39054.1 16S rRNA (adenine(1518)-N(6)/adenine(1519)-N(6))-dimethyltransferase RsmA [Thermodesulfobacteriota bacterium]HQO78710.1 16S rRNA (adenine(1518)-N(6)/adenine(1519)-N(6))-dimethyltransferase RsmA [Thermodesulfobacteriota bacterium]
MMKVYPSQLQLIKHYGIRPKKSLGQNFIIRNDILDQIVGFCELDGSEWVVEIGAGLGGLTVRLADSAAMVLALEKDKQLAQVLENEIGRNKRIKIIRHDALLFDYHYAASTAGTRLVVAGNLPYNVASRLTVELIARRECFSRMVFMYQQEVAERIMALPGTKDYGVLTLLCNLHTDVHQLLSIGKDAFYPRPKVESTLLRFTFLPSSRVPVENEGYFTAVVKAAFSQRRKKLKNALRKVAGMELSSDVVEAGCIAAGVDPGRRGETLDLREFALLANQLVRLVGEMKDGHDREPG